MQTKMTPRNPNLICAIPWLDKQNYEAICKMAGGSWNMELEFSAWETRAKQWLETLTANGQPFKLMEIDVNAIKSYCTRRSVPINSKALGDFAVELFNNQLPSPIAFEGDGSLRPHDITISNLTLGRGWGPAVSIKNADRIAVSNIVRTDKPKA
jgi:hypothetical protein